MSFSSVIAVTVAVIAGCGSGHHAAPLTQHADLAEQYVKLVLALGAHDPATVDAYYGPTEWRTEAERARRSLADIRRDAGALRARVKALPAAGDGLEAKRARYLIAHLDALLGRLEMVGGKKLSFDDESRKLFGAVAPAVSESRIAEIHARLEQLVPGKGPLPERVETFTKAFVVPRARVEAVFAAAIAECRARTLRHVELPKSESFTVEYVKGKPWAAYNWYKGNYRSVIQINTDLPFTIDQAIPLACHEGYPGHHVYNSLLEQHLVRGRGYREFSIYPLYSPTSLIAEGTADYGVELAFPGKELAEFALRVLFPLAGLATENGANYIEAMHLMEELNDVSSHAARRHVDGELDFTAVAAYLIRERLFTSERAKKYVEFVDANRSYAITYSVGSSLVRDHVERRAGTGSDALNRRWSEFLQVLSSPALPSDLSQ